MSLVKEFREFAVKGNAIDMAIGVIIGAGFGKIVTSLVGDVLMPPLGILIGGVDFSGLKFTLKSASDGVEAVTLNYGSFIQTLVDFTIIAFVIFLLLKGINSLKTPPVEEKAVPVISNEEKLLGEIRDILKIGAR